MKTETNIKRKKERREGRREGRRERRKGRKKKKKKRGIDVCVDVVLGWFRRVSVEFVGTSEGLIEAEKVGEGEALGVGQDGDRVFDAVVDDVLDLELVFVVGVRVRQGAEFLRQLEAVRHVLRRHKVLRHFDAAVQIADLKPVDS